MIGEMSAIHTSVVADAHAYTRSRCPWIIAEHTSVYGKLIHYIAGGGMVAFGRTVRQEEVRRRRVRFLVGSSVVFALWLVFLVF